MFIFNRRLKGKKTRDVSSINTTSFDLTFYFLVFYGFNVQSNFVSKEIKKLLRKVVRFAFIQVRLTSQNNLRTI